MAIADGARIWELGKSLKAFRYQEPPTYFGNRWFRPQETASLTDVIHEAFNRLSDTMHYLIMVRLVGYTPLEDRTLRAKVALSKELAHLATRTTEIWENSALVKITEGTTPQRFSQEDAQHMLYWLMSINFSESNWETFAEHMGENCPQVCRNPTFQRISRENLPDDFLIPWYTMNTPPPINLFRVILNGKASEIQGTDLLNLKAWIEAYNKDVDASSSPSPHAGQLLQLIEWANKQAARSRGLNPLDALNVLRSKFKLNVFSTDDALQAQVRRTQIGNTVCVNQGEASAYYTLTEFVPAILTDRMKGIDCIWEAKPATINSLDSETSEPVEKVWIYAFSNPTLGLLYRQRLEALKKIEAAAFPQEYLSEAAKFKEGRVPNAQEIYSPGATFVIKAPQNPGQLESVSQESWKAFFDWTVEKKEHVFFDPFCVGMEEGSSQLQLLDLWTPSERIYTDSYETEQIFDRAYLRQHFEEHFIPQGSRELPLLLQQLLIQFEAIAPAATA